MFSFMLSDNENHRYRHVYRPYYVYRLSSDFENIDLCVPRPTCKMAAVIAATCVLSFFFVILLFHRIKHHRTPECRRGMQRLVTH